MNKKIINYRDEDIVVHKYSESDLVNIYDSFIYWYYGAMRAKMKGYRKPPIPEEFTEKYASYKLGLYHKDGPGADAYDIHSDGSVEGIEIKATSTDNGFQGAVNPNNFDRFIWFDFSGWEDFTFSIYEIPKHFVSGLTKKDRIILRSIVNRNNISPLWSGSILISKEQMDLSIENMKGMLTNLIF
jgi:hypothetical protein